MHPSPTLFVFHRDTGSFYVVFCFPMTAFNFSSSLCPPDDLPRKKSPQIYKPPTPEMLAYLDFSVSTTGILAGVKV